MNSARGAKSPSNHDLNIFLDRQIQNKLLEIDDQLWLTDYMVESKGNTELKVPKTIKVSRNEDVTGWFSSSKCVLRKLEKEKPTPQPLTYSWREQTRLKNLIQNSFVFKHYPYHQSYIEQYREENSQLSGIKTVTQKESNEPRKIAVQNTATITSAQNNITASGNNYSQNSGQNICSHCNQPYTVSTSQPLITAAFSYTRRENTSLSNGACKCSQSNFNPIPHSTSSHTCTKHNHHQHKDVASLAYKYKLSKEALMHNIAWKSESDNSSEHEKDPFKTPRVASGKRSAGKAPTKVTVPSLPNGHNKNIQTVTVQQISQGKPSGDGLSVATTQQNLRALDALSCVAAEKQRKTRPYSTVQVRALGHILMDTIKGVGIKRPDSRLMYTAMDFSRSKSELPEKPESKNGSLDGSQEHLPTLEDSGLILPEDIAVISDEASDVISISKLSTICLGADMKTRENDGLEHSCAIQLFPNNDIMMQNAMRVLNSGTVVWHPSASVTPSQKEKFKKEFTLHNPSPTITHKTPDLKDSQKVSTNLHRSQSEARIDFPIIRTESRSGMLVSDINMSKQAKLGKNGRTSSSMETRAPLIPKGNVMKNLRHKYAGYVRSKNLRKTKSETTLFSLPKPSPPQTDGRSSSVKPYPSEYSNFPDNMKVSQVYTLWSTDGNRSTFTSSDIQSASGSRYQDEDERRLQKVAQYILNEHLDSSIETRMKQEVAVADGILNSDHPNMDGLTWLEKMELLRSIKGKKEKSKQQKQPKFTFVKDIPPEDKHQRLIGNKGSPSPDNMTSLAAQGQTNSQLFEQRRIKHLLQQARLKRNVNFDWLTESPRFRHSQNSSKDDSDDSSVSDIEEEHLRTKSPKCFSPGMDVGHAESTLLSRYNIKPFVKGGGGGWKVTPMTMQRARTIVYDD